MILSLGHHIMRKDSHSASKNVPLSNSAVQRRNYEVANDMVSKLQNSKLFQQLCESTFVNSSTLMTYVRYYSQCQKHIIDYFLCAKYITSARKDEAILQCLQQYFEKSNIPLSNIAAVATNGASTMVGLCREFASLFKEKLPDVRTVDCVLHRKRLVFKKLDGELHDALRVCIRVNNKIKVHPLISQLFELLR